MADLLTIEELSDYQNALKTCKEDKKKYLRNKENYEYMQACVDRTITFLTDHSTWNVTVIPGQKTIFPKTDLNTFEV